MEIPNKSCQRGHHYTPETVYIYPQPNGGARYCCKICKKIRDEQSPQYALRRHHIGKNEYRTEDETAYLILPSGEEVMIDIQDLRRVIEAGRWCGVGKGYALCKKMKTTLHRFIINASEGQVVDHINRNPPDCRRANLRIVSQRENVQNQAIIKDSTASGHKNVYWAEAARLWYVKIRSDGKNYSGGCFHDLNAAIAKASEMRRQLHSHCPENSLPVNG